MREDFITNEAWEDLCWLVYGIEGLSNKYLSKDKSPRKVQRRGGSGVCKLEFAAFHQRNPNGSEFDIRGIEVRSSAYRGYAVSRFLMMIEAHSGRDNKVDLISLSAKLLKK